MRKFVFAVALLIAASGASNAQTHACAEDAQKKAAALLRLHFDGGDNVRISISDEVKRLAPVRALRGKGQFDVLEVWGYIYKAEYRMRFIYAQTKGSCVFMGQEILEAANPY